MRNHKLLIAALILGLTMFQASAIAEMIQGKIANLDLGANALTIERMSPETGQPENLEVIVSDGSTLSGVQSLEELKVGDQVTVEASQDAQSGAFQATAIEVAK